MLDEPFIDKLFCERSMLLSSYSWIFSLRNGFSIFSWTLQRLQRFPPPPPTVLQGGNQENTDWAYEWPRSFPENGMPMKNCFPQKNKKTHPNNPTTVFPSFYAGEPHDFIHIFWCLTAFCSEASHTQVENQFIKPLIILKTWASESLRTFSSLHGEQEIETQLFTAF